MDLPSIRSRLEQETERGLRTGRPLAVVWLRLGDASRGVCDALVEAVMETLRLEDLVAWHEGDLVVVLPDTDESAMIPAGRLLEVVDEWFPEARAGVSRFPKDGIVPDVLLEGALAAARAAHPGETASVGRGVRVIDVGGCSLIVASSVMRSLFSLVERLSRSDISVLISGETGAGKELVARAIHVWSSRSAKPMVAVNCAAITEPLFESELFGHVRGAFTGAVADKIGMLESASGGTILLDEVSECSPQAQAKLLRVLETQRVTPVGATTPRSIDVRIVAATNRSMDVEVGQGRFRSDLFYRLGAASVVIPPLRERGLEVPILARAFLENACERLSRPHLEISRGAIQRLCLHDWPGNVRELKNLMIYLASTLDGARIEAEHLPETVAASAPPWKVAASASLRSRGASPGHDASLLALSPQGFRPIKEEIAELERTRMLQALEAAAGVRNHAAELIDMPLRTFVTKLRRYDIQIPRGCAQGDETRS